MVNLTIYLANEGLSSPDNLLRETGAFIEQPRKLSLEGIGELYVAPSPERSPNWASFFAKDVEDISDLGKSQTSSALLLVSAENRVFALTFGQGRYLLKTELCERRFGLLVTLNSIDPSHVRSLDTQHFDAIAKKSRDQAVRDAEPWEFGLDVEKVVLRGVTGTPLDPKLGRRLTGRDALYATLDIKIGDLEGQLSTYLRKFHENTYRRNFSWIDAVKIINNPAERAALDRELVSKLRNRTLDNIYLTPPGVIDWTMIRGFRYSAGRTVSSLHLPDLLSSEPFSNGISLDLLQSNNGRIDLLNDAGNIEDSWSVYQCLYAELRKDDDTYILSEEIWYQVDKHLLSLVDQTLQEIAPCDLPFSECLESTEEDYNRKIAETGTPDDPDYFSLMDRKLIPFGGGYSRIEFCDIYSRDRHIVHIKRYRGSASLSHLFAQGLVAGEAFAIDDSFRNWVRDKLPMTHEIDTNNFDANSYRIVFGIIGGPETPRSLPFFSRLNLMHAYKRLSGFRYNVSVAQITIGKIKEAELLPSVRPIPDSEFSSPPAVSTSKEVDRFELLPEIQPRHWQREALRRWITERRGIVQAVTGCGKTILAYLCINNFLSMFPGGRVVIVVPTVVLLDQWFLDICESTSFKDSDISCYSGESHADSPRVINMFVLNTARRLAREVSEIGDPTFLIVDECHRAGSIENALALRGDYVATLGLSATPDREYDDGFETRIVPVLGSVIYRYDYPAARRDRVIVDFDLVNIDIAVDQLLGQPSVLAAMNKIAHRTAALSAEETLREQWAAKLALTHQGQRIVIFHERIESLDRIVENLARLNLNSVTYHSKLSESHRRDNLRLFRRGMISVLVTCRALDEGANIPEASVAIVARSTKSTRQRIQRLGRVLRPSHEKRSSTIYTLHAGREERDRLDLEAQGLIGVAQIFWKKSVAH